MEKICVLIVSLTLFFTAQVVAKAPVLDQPIPLLQIDDKGELVLSEGKYSYRPWRSTEAKNLVHVLQYFPATMRARKIFEPFTDRLKTDVPAGEFTVTTVLNLDAAMWGTSGFVVSEVKASKKEFPAASMVLDEEGAGQESWELGKKGALLLIMDSGGKIIYLTRKSLTEQEMNDTIGLMLNEIES